MWEDPAGTSPSEEKKLRGVTSKHAGAGARGQRRSRLKFDDADRLAILEPQRRVEPARQPFHCLVLRVSGDEQAFVAKGTCALDQAFEQERAKSALLQLTLHAERNLAGRRPVCRPR